MPDAYWGTPLTGASTDLAAEFPELFHYTSIAGMSGMVETNSIWCTHYTGMNDASEASVWKDALLPHLSQWLDKNWRRFPSLASGPAVALGQNRERRIEDAARAELDHISSIWLASDRVDLAPIVNPFVSSLCAHGKGRAYEQAHGLLSQWRGYGKEGGVCLVFDTRKLMDMLLDELSAFEYVFGTIGTVCYSDNDELLTQVFEAAIPFFEFVFSGRKPLPKKQFLKIKDPMLRLAMAIANIKHAAFKEESEIRIMMTPVLTTEVELVPDVPITLPFKQIRHRTVRDRQVPFISLFGGSSRLPIKRVIVGPAARQKRNAHIARGMLSADIEVTASATPFIG